MRASGGPERHIRYNDIVEVRYEVSVEQSRPFRRIVIQGSGHAEDDFIDVSMRHFRAEDISQLIGVVRSHRPDLEIPAIPLG